MKIEIGVRPDGDWTAVPNSIIRSTELRATAKAVLCLLLSCGDGWQTNGRALTRQLAEGKDAVFAALADLEAAGYLQRDRQRDDRGRLEWVLTLDWNRILAPCPENPDMADFQTAMSGLSLSGKSGQRTTYSETKGRRTSCSARDGKPDSPSTTSSSDNDNDHPGSSLPGVEVRATGVDRSGQMSDHGHQPPSPPSAAAIMAAWVDRHGNAAPFRKVRGKWQSEIQSLIEDGAEQWMIEKALDLCADRNAGPGMLSHLADDIRRNPDAHIDLPVSQEWLRYA